MYERLVDNLRPSRLPEEMPLLADRRIHMSLLVQPDLVQEAGRVPAQPVVTRIRRLVVVAALAAFVYGVANVAGKGYCPGGVNTDGTMTDAAGNATDVAPSCVALTLQPSAFIYIGIFAIVIGALTLVTRRAANVPAALRYLDRGAAAVVILAVASVIISQIWFGLIPISDWDGGGTFLYPFPFGSVDLEITPMNTP
ncbi:hypothetical protein [Homoserinimonas sp. OAct 916]|uniref:hypothetical protein n=1 Tax=Homoserinimonas sp. OAct 916 TaxID=2211450 RepID=UPI00130042D3|nr:hypothetical protein [Homoserinimonas sp. OAct 916]